MEADTLVNDTNTYDLLNEQWIMCEMDDKSIANFGLIEFNNNVNKIAKVIVPEIASSNFPFYELAFYRFINVLYSRALNFSEWDDIDSKFGLSDDEIAAVNKYLIDHKDCFDVFSKQKPFMQCTDMDLNSVEIEQIPNATSFVTSFVNMPSENAIKTNGLLGYDLQVRPGNANKIINQIADEIPLSPKEATYHLLYLNSFVKCAGVAGCSSISSTPELYIMFRGDTIGQTIKMNLVQAAQEQTRPIWERESILSYYKSPEQVDYIGYTFFPNRFCKYEWDENGFTRKLLYAPHNFETMNTKSKEVCRSNSEVYYQAHDRDALIKIVDDKIISLKYNRTENWLTLLMSAVISDNEIPESSQAGKFIFSGSVILPEKITIVLYGRSADGKSGVYQYSEKIIEHVDSNLFQDPVKRAYVEKYIKLVRAQFAISKNVVNKYYKLIDKINPHVENKVPFINQQISLYAHKKVIDMYNILSDGVDIEKRMVDLMNEIKRYARVAVLDMLSENVLAATQAYNSVVFGGKK